MILVGYPKCTTCKKAEKYLKEKGIDFRYRHIKEEQPRKEELKAWHQKSGLELRKFFNTSGQLYREYQLKDKIGSMTMEEMLDCLASDGMLVKRPILLTKDKVLLGFKEKEWESLF